MALSLQHRLPVVLAVTAVASALAATPALATEGPGAPPPGPTLPSGVAPPTFAPSPFTTTPSASSRALRLIRRARLVHRRVQQGRRGRLRVSLVTPSRLRIKLTRSASGHRIRTIDVPARGSTVAVRLPAHTRGHDLRVGRYRVRVVAIDASGARSRPVRLSMIVHR
jgi:hypothetical protein